MVGALLCYGGGTYAGMIYMRGRGSPRKAQDEEATHIVTESQRNVRIGAFTTFLETSSP